MNRKVAFHTLGCKLNFAETSSIARSFEEAGYIKVSFQEKADVYVMNTCSVTENADKECRQLVKQLTKQAPEAFIAVIGCYAQLKPNEIAEIPGVDIVLGASEKFNLLNYLDDISKKEQAQIHSCEINEVNTFENAYSLGDRTRSFLKVQDGCDYTCSYCTIPMARGNSRSDSIARIVQNAKELAQKGIKEIVLTGVNIGDFGIGQNGQRNESFLSLLNELDNVIGIERYRISSIEPNLLKNEIIDFVSSSKKFVPHFHIPLQSGSNTILKLMRRRYLRELYYDRVQRIKETMPFAAIGVDVIVGFPGETEELFDESYTFLNSLPVSYLHVFTYSERENTDASSYPGSVPVNIRRERNKKLRILSDKKSRYFYHENLNRKVKVLFENENKEGWMQGFSENYIKVLSPYQPSLANNLIEVKLQKINQNGNYEIPISQPKETFTL